MIKSVSYHLTGMVFPRFFWGSTGSFFHTAQDGVMWTWSKSINNPTPTLKSDWAIKGFYMNRNTDTFRYIYPSVRTLVGVQNTKVNLERPVTSCSKAETFPHVHSLTVMQTEVWECCPKHKARQELPYEYKNSYTALFSDSGLWELVSETWK